MSDPYPGQFDDDDEKSSLQSSSLSSEDESTDNSYKPPNKIKKINKIESESHQLSKSIKYLMKKIKKQYGYCRNNINKLQGLVEDKKNNTDEYIRAIEQRTSMSIVEIKENSQKKKNSMFSAIKEKKSEIKKLENTFAMTQQRLNKSMLDKAAGEISRLEREIKKTEEMTSMTIAEIIENVNTSQGKADGTKSAIDEDIAKIKELANDLAMTQDRLNQIIKEKAAAEISRLEREIQTTKAITSMKIPEIIENVINSQSLLQSLSVTTTQAKGNIEKSTHISIENSFEALRTQLDVNEEEFGNDDDDEVTKRCGRRKRVAPTPSDMGLGQEDDDGDYYGLVLISSDESN